MIDISQAKDLAVKQSSQVFKSLLRAGFDWEEIQWSPKEKAAAFDVFYKYLTCDHPSDYQERVQALNSVVDEMVYLSERETTSTEWACVFHEYIPIIQQDGEETEGGTPLHTVSNYCRAATVWASVTLHAMSPEHPVMFQLSVSPYELSEEEEETPTFSELILGHAEEESEANFQIRSRRSGRFR